MQGMEAPAIRRSSPAVGECEPPRPAPGRSVVDAVLAVRSGEEAWDWRDAIRMAAAPLLQVGAVSAHYVDGSVEMVEAGGPFILVSPDIAVAHACLDEGASALALSLVRLVCPIPFGHSHGYPVRLVFVLATPSAIRHDVILGRLVRALMNGAGGRLEVAGSDAEASKILEGAILVDDGLPC